MPSSPYRLITPAFPLLLLAALLAGCGSNPNTSYYGTAWITLQSEPAPDFAAYNVTIDSVTLTRNDGVVVSAIGTPEIVDLTQVGRITEMWGSGAVPDGTYLSATITFDYTNAVIAVKQNGKAVQAKVLDPTTKAAPTTYAVTVNFDPANQLVVTPTYASTSAHLLALDVDLAASSRIDYTTSPATVYPAPYVTIGVQRPDTRLIRVRGPLINSSSGVQSYSVYVRPFYDEANNIGTLSLFGQSGTLWTINGKTYIGPSGLAALSVLSAGITMTAGYTQFVPDFNTANQAAAGTFYLNYVIAGGTLEDEFTEGISGEVVARSGNTLTLANSTLFLNTADEFIYELNPTQVLLGSGTIVTADDNTTLTNLTEQSVAVGQHIVARGLYNVAANGTIIIDSTGTTSTDTGSVRLQPTDAYGSLVSSASGSLVMDLQALNGWPVSFYNFAGNGATTLNPAAFTVATGALTLPAGTAVGDPVFATGFVAPFGSAPPDFTAVALNNEASVQAATAQVGGGVAHSPGPAGICAQGSQVCIPATYEVAFAGTGSAAPFTSISTSGFTLDLAGASARLFIGAELIDATTLASSPMVVPIAPASYASSALTFQPRYSYGNPLTATTTSASTTAATTVLEDYSSFSSFATALKAAVTSTTPAVRMTAHGVWNRASNVFTATSIDFVI